MVYKRIRGQTSGRSLPVKLCSVPPGFQTVPYSTFPSRFLVKQSPHVINCLITLPLVTSPSLGSEKVMYETSARIFVNLDCFLYRKGVIIDYIIHSMQMFLSFHLPRAHHVTCKYLTTNNVSAHVQCRPTVFG